QDIRNGSEEGKSKPSLTSFDTVLVSNTAYIFFGLPFLCLDVKSSLQDLIALSLHLDYLVQVIVTAMLAILFNVAVVLQITYTSTVTYSIVSALRGGVQMLICAYLFGESLTTGKILGVSCVVSGTLVYTYSTHHQLLHGKKH
ncbi:hypothetical protein FOZ63_010201, partial [Perkinsus olseni]